MIAAGLVAFNLLLNGVATFVLTWLLVRAAVRVFRPAPGFAHIALLGIPFARLAVDLARGVPDHSFLWLRSQGIPQDLGSFKVGFGIWWLVPNVQLELGALSRGEQYTQSAADLLAALLTKRVSVGAPLAIAIVLLAVGIMRLARRAVAWERTARERRVLSERAEIVRTVRVGWRTVPVLVSSEVAGSPFTSGLLSPCVVVARQVWEALTPEEQHAAIAHELAHVAEHHLLVTTAAGIVRDLFWFVPLMGSAERGLREACELAADARAVRGGVSAPLLASALVRVCESMVPPSTLPAATLAAGGSSLRVRLARLLDGAPPPRLGFQYAASRVALTVWLAAAALIAVAFGNH